MSDRDPMLELMRQRERLLAARREVSGQLAGVPGGLALAPCREQPFALRSELSLETRDEGNRCRRKHLLGGLRPGGGLNLDSGCKLRPATRLDCWVSI